MSLNGKKRWGDAACRPRNAHCLVFGINGMPHLRAYPLGGLKPGDFLKYRGVNRQGTRRRLNSHSPVVQAALGAASALSPRVVPPLAMGALGGRRIKRYFAGLPLGYAAWADAIVATSAP